MKVDATGPTLAEPGGVAAPAPTGSTLGKYRLDRVIGEGGMGVVWAGYDPDLERAVAIKVLRDAGDTTLRTRLLREARAMARLKHPNVLTVYEVGTDDNRDYIAMDLVDGGDLTAWLVNKPPRKDIFDALIGAGRGLAAAHDAGLIHRDFKPHNVLRGTDARVYVTDFGLARGQLEPEVDIQLVPMRGHPVGLASGSEPRRPFDSVLDAELTQTGILIGTPAYMAPEQYAGLAPDPRTDQFSFCVTAWEALSGSRPFTGDSLDALRNAVGGGVAKTPAELPSSVRAVLSRGLDPEPSKRWPDMRSLLSALEKIAAPRRRIAGIMVVVGAVILATGVTFAVMNRSSSDHNAIPGHCSPADEEFGSAWSSARREEIRKAHPHAGMIGTFAILDQVRREWLDAYDKACTLPATTKSTAAVSCLLGIRDEIIEETRELDGDDPEGESGTFAMFIPSIKSCTNER
ncbi:MAG TPA: serine/threonine-protein kinase [Kofleriaceae bacterium]|nr:serine/threonine-protein kinase [Kofleriaceae bacterium]